MWKKSADFYKLGQDLLYLIVKVFWLWFCKADLIRARAIVAEVSDVSPGPLIKVSLWVINFNRHCLLLSALLLKRHIIYKSFENHYIRGFIHNKDHFCNEWTKRSFQCIKCNLSIIHLFTHICIWKISYKN